MNKLSHTLKKTSVFALSALLGVSGLAVLLPQPVSAFAGGNGTSGSPYQIASCADFKDIEDDPNAHYVLNQDINCTAQGNSARLLGDPFMGTFDGQNHTITIAIAEEDAYRVGLFPQLDNATISNLTVAGSVTASRVESHDPDEIGAISGDAWESVLDNITVTATVSGHNRIGGMVGVGNYLEISNSSTSGDVSAAGELAGGLVGAGSALNIWNSYSTANVSAIDEVAGGIAGSAESYEGDDSSFYGVYATGDVSTEGQLAGGLIGFAEDTSIEESYTTDGDVSSPRYAGGLVGVAVTSRIDRSYSTKNVTVSVDYGGGLVGEANNTEITESFATGNVSGGLNGDYIGGLSGLNSSDTEIYNSYARGNVEGRNYVGGFSGQHGSSFILHSYSTGDVTGTGEDVGGFNGAPGESVIFNSFWDTQTSGLASSIGAAGKSTAEMKDIATYTSSATDGMDVGDGLTVWDFVGTPNDDEDDGDIWAIGEENDGYPCLTWINGCVLGEETPSDSDSDGDGIADSVEDDAPNGGDANNDGIADSEQYHVSSFVNTLTGAYNSVALANDDCTITEASATAETAHGTQDSGYSYAAGFVNFAANCGDPGYTATVKIYQYGVLVNGHAVRKHNPLTNAYFTISGATLAQEMVDNQSVATATYEVTDGGELDVDGEENGTIVDPVGLGILSAGTPNTGAQSIRNFIFVKQ